MDNELEFDGMNDTDETEMDELTDTLEAEATDEAAEAAPAPEAAPAIDDATLQRVFKVGSVRIPESEVTSGKSLEDVKKVLKSTYPEVANATTREGKENGIHLIEFLPQPGRKG